MGGLATPVERSIAMHQWHIRFSQKMNPIASSVATIPANKKVGASRGDCTSTLQSNGINGSGVGDVSKLSLFEPAACSMPGPDDCGRTMTASYENPNHALVQCLVH
jgi:hypothetical protein